MLGTMVVAQLQVMVLAVAVVLVELAVVQLRELVGLAETAKT
jgi:hypothetical protein